MAITFTQEKKKQKYLVVILILIILIIFAIVWWGFLGEAEKPIPTTPSFVPKQIQIDWEVLQQEELKNLDAFEGITVDLEEEIGRENPFKAY